MMRSAIAFLSALLLAMTLGACATGTDGGEADGSDSSADASMDAGDDTGGEPDGTAGGDASASGGDSGGPDGAQTGGDAGGDAGTDAGAGADAGDLSDATGGDSGDSGLSLSPEEQATQDLTQGFLGQFVSSLKSAQMQAATTKQPVRLRIDITAREVQLILRAKVVSRRNYPASVEVLKQPSEIWILPNGVLQHTGRNYPKSRLKTRETAHILARVPGYPLHAFVRLYRDEKFHDYLTVRYH